MPAIAALAAEAFPLACPPTTPQSAIDQHIADELNERRFAEHWHHHILLIVDGPDAAKADGYAMLTTEEPPLEKPWHSPIELRRIYVSESAHGTGVAQALMQRSLEIAKAAGHDVVWLGTNEHNTRAVAFYKKCGFDIVGNREFRVADSIECDYVLAREVGDARI